MLTAIGRDGHAAKGLVGADVVEAAAPEGDKSDDKDGSADKQRCVDKGARLHGIHFCSDGDCEADRSDGEPEQGFGIDAFHGSGTIAAASEGSLKNE